MMLRTFVYKFLCGHMFSIFLGISLKMELVGLVNILNTHYENILSTNFTKIKAEVANWLFNWVFMCFRTSYHLFDPGIFTYLASTGM